MWGVLLQQGIAEEPSQCLLFEAVGPIGQLPFARLEGRQDLQVESPRFARSYSGISIARSCFASSY